MSGKRAAAAVTSIMVALGMSAAGASPASAAGPTDYTYSHEWIYSTDASEVPTAAAIDAQGRIYVAAQNAGYGEDDTIVRVYDGAGNLLTTWPGVPIASPGGMDIDPAGNLHITKYALYSSIEVYSPTGTFLRDYRVNSGYEWTAGEVANGPDGTSYVTDPVKGKIYTFNAGGTLTGTHGTEGTQPGQFDSPWGVDTAPDGSIVVADTGNDRIQVFDAQWNFLRQWGQAGTGNGQFVNGPKHVTVRPDGHVYVTDSTSRIQVFTLGGQYVGTHTTLTKRGNSMRSVSDIDFGADQTMYVAGDIFPFEGGVVAYKPGTPPAPPGPGPAPGTTGTAKVAKPKKPIKVKKALKLTINCTSTAPCSGTLTVTFKDKSVTKPTTYSIPAGGKQKVTVKLTKAGKKVLKKGKVRKVVATVTGGTTKVKVRR